MQSHAILGALKIKLKAPVRYFCQVTHVGIAKDEAFSTPIIMCLGEHSMFLLDQSMQNVLGEIFYAHTVRVVEQLKSTAGPEDVMRIEINDDRPKGIPGKITVISSEKSMLLKHLRCYWETDYMWRLSKIGTLRVEQERIDLKKYKAKVKDTSSKDRYIYCSNSSIKDEQKGYGYFYPNFLKKCRLIGEYESSVDNVNTSLKVKIEDAVQLEYLKEDMRSKAEGIAEGELEPGERYCFLKNSSYMKKMNLVIDLASWRGWEVTLKTSKRYISVIILRRRYIPPLMDSGQDFVFITISGVDARKISAEPADSIYTKQISNEYYKLILSQRCEALIMDEESASFYQLQLNLIPSTVTLAYRFIYSILDIITKDAPKAEYKELIAEIKKVPGIMINEDGPENIIDQFFKKSEANPKSIEHIKWCEKVCRYLAYCLDGGLFHSRFTLEEVVASIMGGSLRELSQLSALKKCIKRLLHVRRINEHSEIQNEDLYEPIIGLLKESFGKRNEAKKWTLNEKVMICLVESGYLQRELDISGDAIVYPNLLTYFLQSPWTSLELKSVICRVTVGIEDISEFNIFKPLIPHFVDIFANNTYSLASQAAISLINLTYNNRENKQTLYKQRTGILKRLTSKDQKLLSYALVLITNLASEPSRRKAIATEIKDLLIDIVTGKNIEKAYLTSEVLNRAFIALITISKDHTTLDYMMRSEKLIKECAEYVILYDDIIVKVCWLFELIADKSIASRPAIGAEFIPHLHQKLPQSLPIDCTKSMLTLLKVLITVKENLELAISLNIPKVLKQIYSYSEVQNDIPTLKLISSLIKNDFSSKD